MFCCTACAAYLTDLPELSSRRLCVVKPKSVCCDADSQFMAAVFDEGHILPTDPGQPFSALYLMIVSAHVPIYDTQCV